jgi:glycosyltransferase involved in cell wall biosynthesis
VCPSPSTQGGERLSGGPGRRYPHRAQGCTPIRDLSAFSSDTDAGALRRELKADSNLREVSSISLLEAMASSHPIVATSISPAAGLIRHEKTGLFVDVRSPWQMAGAKTRFALEPESAIRCSSFASE